MLLPLAVNSRKILCLKLDDSIWAFGGTLFQSNYLTNDLMKHNAKKWWFESLRIYNHTIALNEINPVNRNWKASSYWP